MTMIAVVAVVVVIAAVGVALVAVPNLLGGGGGGSTGITVTHPLSGSSHATNSVCNIQWTKTGDTGANVRIEFGYQGGPTMLTIVASTANTGSFDWNIPAELTPRNNYYVQVTSTTNASIFDQSDLFAITQGGGMFNNPQVGDYVAYSSNFASTMRMEVTIVNATNCTVKTTTTIGTFTVSSNKTHENKSAAFTGQFDPADLNLPAGTSLTYAGKESIATPYGSRNCDKYHLTILEPPGSGDLWYYGGIFVKMSHFTGVGTGRDNDTHWNEPRHNRQRLTETNSLPFSFFSFLLLPRI